MKNNGDMASVSKKVLHDSCLPFTCTWTLEPNHVVSVEIDIRVLGACSGFFRLHLLNLMRDVTRCLVCDKV